MSNNELSFEQQESARSAQTLEEIEELAKEEGQEISDDRLDAVSGGWGTCSLCSCFDPGCVQKMGMSGQRCEAYRFF